MLCFYLNYIYEPLIGLLSKGASLRQIGAKGETNLRIPDTERTLGEGLFAFELDHRALLIVRSDARDKVDDQRTMCLSI